jgi:hypothetical protein
VGFNAGFSFSVRAVVSRGLSQQIRSTLTSKRIMYMEFEAFRGATEGCDKLFEKWKEEFERFREEARELKAYRSCKSEFAAKVCR